jgi:RPA family protein
MKKIISIIILVLTIHSFSQETINTDKAKDNLDKLVFVEGKVVSMRLASDGKTINYLNLDKKYPDNVFSVVITNDYLVKLNIKLEDLKDKIIIVKGKISVYKNDPKQIPQIFNPESIEIQK